MSRKPQPAPRTLTDAFVRQCRPDPARRLEIRDGMVAGLVLRVTPTGRKTFSLHTRGPTGKTIQLTLGRYPTLGLKAARDLAREHIRTISAGKDPREIRRRARAAAEAEALTLRRLLDEAETQFAPTKTVWRSGGRSGRRRTEARAAIENVFAGLLDEPLARLTESHFSEAARSYRPRRPKAGKSSANGSVSRSLSYLRPVLDWAAGRNSFRREGAGRDPQIEAPDVSVIHDPASDDPSIVGIRERVLTQSEAEAVLPLLTYPAPAGLRDGVDPEHDYAPAAMLFIALTLARCDEVCTASRKQFDLRARTWTREVKTRRKPGSSGAGRRRVVTTPLSDAAVALLEALPSFREGGPDDLVFPSSTGGRLWNWQKSQDAIFAASGTRDWHRHDLRRSGATILRQLGVASVVIDTLLAHANPLGSENVSAAAPHYVMPDLVLMDGPDPAREAVNLLARALRKMGMQLPRSGGSERACCLPRQKSPGQTQETPTIPAEPAQRDPMRSPWYRPT